MRMPFLVIILTYTIAITGLILIEGVDANGEKYHMSIFDAFYFVSYMATTIGFGEAPYEFTYGQRIWVTFSIYLTVLGWFYGIGSLVSLLQDKLFLHEIEKAKFTRQVKNIKERFIIILGYNQITSQIIQKAIEEGVRAVVIESEKTKVNDLILENFTPTVPVLHSDSYSIRALENAGIKRKNCKAVVSLFEDDALNLKIALTSKLLNKYIKVVAKSTTRNHSENLKDVDTEIIVNPFSIISTEISMALNAPNLFRLEKWLYKIDDLTTSIATFPKGKYIICGYGRFGKKIYEKLSHQNIEVKLVDLNKECTLGTSSEELSNVVFANADDKSLLSKMGIKQCDAIIAATDDDTTNLSILATAKKLNPKIMTIVRENEMEDFSIFKNANINHIFMPSKILINKTSNALINPLNDQFIRLMIKKDEKWASLLVSRLIKEIDANPMVFEIEIDERESPIVYDYLKGDNQLSIDIFSRSLYNRETRNNVIPLLIQKDENFILLPSIETNIDINDKILFACDEHAKNDIEYMIQNFYEFYYALDGKEKRTIFKGNK
jgi:Trk K+ transport system NAD-binding subunit